jgi:hypothetical protein
MGHHKCRAILGRIRLGVNAEALDCRRSPLVTAKEIAAQGLAGCAFFRRGGLTMSTLAESPDNQKAVAMDGDRRRDFAGVGRCCISAIEG